MSRYAINSLLYHLKKDPDLRARFMKDPRGSERAGFETAVTLNRKDFGIVWNRALDAGGVLLGDDVWVSINLETRKEAPPSPPAQ